MTPKKTFWSTCRVTAYCPCVKCCGSWANKRPKDANGKPIVRGAAGTRLQSKVSCASSLPFGTKLYIPDLNLTLVVEDRAAKSIDRKYSGKYIDIYVDNHSGCYDLLRGCKDYMEVYIVSKE